MRLRHIKGANEHINQHPSVVLNPEVYKGRWQEYFNNQHPIFIEIGMGKGDFIIENARTYPEVNFIGIEKFSAVLLRGVQKVEELEEVPKNLCLLRFDAVDLLNIFDMNEIGRVYLNFSDPWPKDRWAKRRLTHRNYLKKYTTILPKGGIVRFKTDNTDLFRFSLEEIEGSTFEKTKETFDLYHSEYLEGNIMTEYEARFVQEDKPIHFVEIRNTID